VPSKKFWNSSFFNITPILAKKPLKIKKKQHPKSVPLQDAFLVKGNIFHMPFVAPTPPETIDLDCPWARQIPICLSNLATLVAKVCVMLFSCSGVPSPLTSYLTTKKDKGVIFV